MGWLSGWQYRKSHVINSASGAGTNYQVRIKAHYGSGTDSGENVYLNSHCRTDFGDVRFTDDDGETLLDYWMESKVDSDYAIFWVEVADDLSTTAQTIYIYYGNPNATTTSNGFNTFLVFDHFDTDLSNWTIISGNWSISNGELVSATTDDDQIRHNTGDLSNIRIRSKYRGVQAYAYYKCMARWQDANNLYGYQQRVAANKHYMDVYKRVGGTWTQLGSSVIVSDTGSHIMEFRLFGSSLVGLRDEVQTHSVTDSTFTSGYIGIRRGVTSSTAFFYIDWIFVAKYVSPEPSHGSWGSEETFGGQIYEIYVDAVSQLVAMPAYETTFNISKDASITSQSLTASETIFRIEKEIVVGAFAEVVVEKVVGQIFEIFKDAITQASVSFQAFGVYPVDVEALVKASAMPSLQQTLGISKDAVATAVSTLLTQSAFSISPEATIKVLAEFSIIKQTEVKITRLFLVMGDLAIQIQGS